MGLEFFILALCNFFSTGLCLLFFFHLCVLGFLRSKRSVFKFSTMITNLLIFLHSSAELAGALTLTCLYSCSFVLEIEIFFLILM